MGIGLSEYTLKAYGLGRVVGLSLEKIFHRGNQRIPFKATDQSTKSAVSF